MTGLVMEVQLIKNQDGSVSVVTHRSNKGEPHDTILPPFAERSQLEAISLALDALAYEREKWMRVPDLYEALKTLGLVDEQGFANLQRGVGHQLFESFFPKGALREALHETVDPSFEQKDVARLELRFDAPELGNLPWELLCDEDGKGFLFSGRNAIVVRYVVCNIEPLPLLTASILRVLLITARPHSGKDDPVLLPELTDSEDAAIKDALATAENENRIRLGRLPAASERTSTYLLLSDLLDSVKELSGEQGYHVVHIDAHGGFGKLCEKCKTLNNPAAKSCKNDNANLPHDSQGYVAFERTDGGPDWVSAEKLAALLMGSGIRLVVLTACKSAVMSGESIFSGIAPAIAKTGIPAVVAMQYSISDKAAFEFTYRLYRALCRFKPLTEAMASVHPYLFHPHPAEWYKPVLYLRSDPKNQEGQLFTIANGKGNGDAFGEQTAETIDRMISRGGDVPQRREALIALGVTCQQIKEMAYYKTTHDLIQQLDSDVRPVRRDIDESDMQGPAPAVPWSKLREKLDTLDQTITRLKTHMEAEAVDNAAKEWANDLSGAYSTIEQAAKVQLIEESRDMLEGALMTIETTIKLRSQEMNRSMIEALRVLDLSRLVGALRGLYTRFQNGPDGIGPEELSDFGNAIESLDDLEDNLQVLLSLHDGWQQIEDELRPWAGDIRYRDKTGKFRRQWRVSYKHRMTALTPSAELTRRMDTLEKALCNYESHQDVITAFDAFFGGMLRDFTRVDCKLKSLCDNLRKCSTRLEDKVKAL
jgi:hypothetical protein